MGIKIYKIHINWRLIIYIQKDYLQGVPGWYSHVTLDFRIVSSSWIRDYLRKNKDFLQFHC